MAESSPTKPIYMFYHIQNDKGESSAHPNACKISPATAGTVKLRDVLNAFPLTGTSSFHFRFQIVVDKQIMFLDLINPDDVVPMVNGSVIAKILRLDNAKCSTRNSYGLKLRKLPAAPIRRPAPSPAAATAEVKPVSSPPSASPKSPDAAEKTPVASPVPMVKPVKAVEDHGPVVVPDVVDEDLADKSDYVKAKVMERRQKLAEEQARRIAEASERDAAQKKEQDDRETARVTYGPRLKEWAEEASGTKKNIRLLLSTLHSVLWPDASWEALAMAKLIEPRRVKFYYMKALTIVHPDKQNAMDSLQKFIATQVFHYLETAFRLFQETEMPS